MNSGFVNLTLFSPLKNFRFFCYFKHIQKDKMIRLNSNNLEILLPPLVFI